MKFTVVFSSNNESEDLSFGLVFIPCPVWVQGERELINLNPERPDYLPGSVRKLVEKVPALRHADQRCHVITHDLGHGSDANLSALVEDLKAEGFSVDVL